MILIDLYSTKPSYSRLSATSVKSGHLKHTVGPVILLNIQFYLKRKIFEFIEVSLLLPIARSIHQRCSVKKGVLRNPAKFTRKHLCQASFLIRLQAWGTGFLPWILRNFQEQLFYKTPLDDCFSIDFPKQDLLTILHRMSVLNKMFCCKKDFHDIIDVYLWITVKCRLWLVFKKPLTLHKKWSFPLRISSVNVTKSTVSCGFGLVIFTEEILNGELHFLWSVSLDPSLIAP